uniref:Retrotransposon gag domain-containing protein n=1 Tax=Latimeria chalumnae TaxID=7897 RepID=H2ZS10_LATCH
MATAAVPLSAPFFSFPGEPVIPFKIWKKMFENYMLVIDIAGENWPEAWKHVVLLHCLGTEGQHIFYTLPNRGTTCASAVSALETHFALKVNMVAERHRFRQCAQGLDETIVQYVAALRELVSPYDFGDKTDVMLRDQIVEKASNSQICERLLLEPNLTLEKSIAIGCQIEPAIKNAQMLVEGDTLPVQAVN